MFNSINHIQPPNEQADLFISNNLTYTKTYMLHWRRIIFRLWLINLKTPHMMYTENLSTHLSSEVNMKCSTPIIMMTLTHRMKLMATYYMNGFGTPQTTYNDRHMVRFMYPKSPYHQSKPFKHNFSNS